MDLSLPVYPASSILWLFCFCSCLHNFCTFNLVSPGVSTISQMSANVILVVLVSTVCRINHNLYINKTSCFSADLCQKCSLNSLLGLFFSCKDVCVIGKWAWYVFMMLPVQNQIWRANISPGHLGIVFSQQGGSNTNSLEKTDFRKNPAVRLFLQLHWFCIGWNCSSCVMASELSGLCKCPVNTGSDHTRSTSTWSSKFNYMMIMILIWQLILIIYLKLYLLIQCSSSIISAKGKRNLTLSKFLFTTY